jgi:hypothetical protein
VLGALAVLTAPIIARTSEGFPTSADQLKKGLGVMVLGVIVMIAACFVPASSRVHGPGSIVLAIMSFGLGVGLFGMGIASAIDHRDPIETAGKPVGTQLIKVNDQRLTAAYSVDFIGDPRRPRLYGTDVQTDLVSVMGAPGYLGSGLVEPLKHGQATTYRSCRLALRQRVGFVHDRLELNKIHPGQYICLESDRGPYSVLGLIHIRAVHGDGRTESDYVTYDLTVWKAQHLEGQ